MRLVRPFIATLVAFASLTSAPHASAARTRTYHVYAVSTRLNVRSGPGMRFRAVGSMTNGTPLQIACQTHGDWVGRGIPGTPSNTWDKLASGGWISDYYTDTPGEGGAYTRGLGVCG
jgi:uncharacterized protein YraI